MDEGEEYIALSLDIEKAFDSVQWNFLYSFMQSLGFPSEFIHWVQVLHQGKELRVFNNRHASQPIMVTNGLAQGCSLSPLLFILCMESLARVIRGNTHIEGVCYANKEKKIGMIADDTVLIFKATSQGLQKLMQFFTALHNRWDLELIMTNR